MDASTLPLGQTTQSPHPPAPVHNRRALAPPSSNPPSGTPARPQQRGWYTALQPSQSSSWPHSLLQTAQWSSWLSGWVDPGWESVQRVEAGAESSGMRCHRAEMCVGATRAHRQCVLHDRWGCSFAESSQDALLESKM